MSSKVTFAMIKPDAVESKFTGKIVDMIEASDFDIICIKKVRLSKEIVEKFYAEHKDKPFFQECVDFITSGPVVAMVLRKEDGVLAWRNLMGATDPSKADKETVRAKFGKNIGNNAVHGSDSDENACREINLIFPDFEIA